MTTKSKQNELLIYGYIHEIENLLDQIIPSSIALVISLFYPRIEEFKWDDDKHGVNATIINDKTARAIGIGSVYWQWAVCVSGNIISSDLCDWYEWELKLNHWNDRQSAFRFGFVAVPIDDTIKNWDEGLLHKEDYKHYTIDVCNGISAFRAGPKFDYIKYDGWNYLKPKVGDRFKVRIDFKDREIKLWYNDKFVDSVYKDAIPDVVVPAACLMTTDITIINTDYE